MENFKVQKAATPDALDIYKLNKECLPVYYSEMENKLMIKHDAFIVLIVREINTNNACGYLISQNKTNRYHIMSIGVSSLYRSKNIGSMMINYLVDLVKDKTKIISLYVHVENIKAINFYVKNNFSIKEKKEKYYGKLDGYILQDAYFMHKKID